MSGASARPFGPAPRCTAHVQATVVHLSHCACPVTWIFEVGAARILGVTSSPGGDMLNPAAGDAHLHVTADSLSSLFVC